MSRSVAETLADLPTDMLAEAVDQLWPDGNVPQPWDLEYYGRPEQIWRPGPETYTVYTAGRGWGKGYTGSHAVDHVARHPELCGGREAEGPDDHRSGQGAVIGIAGRTANDVNQTMVDGDSGIMAACDPALRPVWHKSDKTLTWATGVKARLMSGDVPDSFRGPNFGFVWADELPHWARAAESWKQCRRAFRKAGRGQHRRAIITSTPLGTEVMRRLVWLHRDGLPVPAGPDTPRSRQLQGFIIAARTRVVVGSTYDNVSNLDADYLAEVGEHEGTADAAQEHHGVIRLDVPGAPVKQDWVRRCELEDVPQLDEVIIAVDPTGSDGELVPRSDLPCECGLVAMGLHRASRQVYGLADRSLVATPDRWADVAIEMCLGWGAATVVVEKNFGGQLLRIALDAAYQRQRAAFRAKGQRKPKIVLTKATVGKRERAGLCGPMFQAGRIWHVGSPRRWVQVERQWTTLDPNRPIRGQQTDRLDAEGWGILYLLGDGSDRKRPRAYTDAEGWARVKRALAAGAGR